MEELEYSMEDVLPLLDEQDQEKLKDKLDEVANEFNVHLFASESQLVKQWMEDKEAELSCMAPCGVQVQPLQVHVTCEYHFVVYTIICPVCCLS